MRDDLQRKLANVRRLVEVCSKGDVDGLLEVVKYGVDVNSAIEVCMCVYVYVRVCVYLHEVIKCAVDVNSAIELCMYVCMYAHVRHQIWGRHQFSH